MPSTILILWNCLLSIIFRAKYVIFSPSMPSNITVFMYINKKYESQNEKPVLIQKKTGQQLISSWVYDGVCVTKRGNKYELWQITGDFAHRKHSFIEFT